MGPFRWSLSLFQHDKGLFASGTWTRSLTSFLEASRSLSVIGSKVSNMGKSISMSVAWPARLEQTDAFFTFYNKVPQCK